MPSSKIWHAYGYIAPEEAGDLAGTWMQAVIGPIPSDVPAPPTWSFGSAYGPKLVELPPMPHIHWWDHNPTEAEKLALEPPDFDGDPNEEINIRTEYRRMRS